MNKAIIYVTFLPWLLYFIIYSIKGIKDTKGVKRKTYFTWLKKHFFQMFRFDTLVLIAVFLYFIKFENSMVDKMLFFAINLYLFVNSIYDKSFKNKNKIEFSELTLVVILLIITTVPFIYYYRHHELINTYNIMFAYTFFSYIIVILAKLLNMPIVRLFNSIRKKKSP